MTRGWPYLAHNVVHDLAALNKQEMLLWDSWGVLERFGPAGPGDQVTDLLDSVAAITGANDSPLHEVQYIYERYPELQVPATVTSYDPMGGPPREVVLGREVTH